MFDEDHGLLWLAPRNNQWTYPARLFIEQDELQAAGLFLGFAKVTQLGAEILTGSVGNVLVTQESAEVLTGSPGNVLVTQFSVEVLAAYPRITEEYWQNPVKPVAASFYRPTVFRDPDEIPTGSLFVPPIQDEDYWINFVRPVAASLYQRLPYLPDPEEITAGYLFAFWAKVTQMSVEVLCKYERQVYTGWTGTSMSVS